MIKYEYIIDAQKCLVDNWGEAGKKVIEEIHKITPFNDNFNEFLNYCTCCGGNWGGMYLTGIKNFGLMFIKLFPMTWERRFIHVLFVPLFFAE